jgi:hypothetical protein
MIEAIVGGAVVAVGRRIGDRWLDDAAEGLDGELRRLLRRLLSRDGGGSSPSELTAAKAELADYVGRTPDAGAQVVRAALTAVPAATRVERMAAFLDVAFALVGGLHRPVFLPGFFNCADCVTVIDARTGTGMVKPLMFQEMRSGHDPESRAMYFDNYEAHGLHLARLWVIPVASKERRDELIGLLDERYGSGTLGELPFQTAMLRAPEGLEESETPLDIERIDRHGIRVKYRATHLSDDWYRITSTEGIDLFGEALARRVQAEIDRDATFNRALRTDRLTSDKSD